MGFEVVFKYHDKIENGYDTLENKTFNYYFKYFTQSKNDNRLN